MEAKKIRALKVILAFLSLIPFLLIAVFPHSFILAVWCMASFFFCNIYVTYVCIREAQIAYKEDLDD